MKTIVWKGGNQMIIPKHGVVDKGSEKDLPDDLAESFVRQNQASFKSKVDQREFEEKIKREKKKEDSTTKDKIEGAR